MLAHPVTSQILMIYRSARGMSEKGRILVVFHCAESLEIGSGLIHDGNGAPGGAATECTIFAELFPFYVDASEPVLCCVVVLVARFSLKVKERRGGSLQSSRRLYTTFVPRQASKREGGERGAVSLVRPAYIAR